MGLGAIFKVALLYTLIGMGTVFLVLIFISICIWLLGVLCGSGKSLPAAEPAAEVGEDIRPETVAAITAALHMYLMKEGAEEDYVVRNVRRATWRHTS